MTGYREHFSSEAEPEMLMAMGEIARQEDKSFQEILETTIREYLDRHDEGKPRAIFMAHFRASLERNRRLSELVADS
jgi:hypothetical protein